MNDNWNKIEQLSNELNERRDKYVPDSGKADTVGGEIIRALDRVIYRYFNDGDMVGVGYGIETVNSSCRYLFKKVPNLPGNFGYTSDENLYLGELVVLAQGVVNYLNSAEGVFNEPNDFDSRDMSDSDREELREWERDSEYDDEDWWEEDGEEYGDGDY